MGDSKDFAAELYDTLSRRRNVDSSGGITINEMRIVWEDMTSQDIDARLQIFFDMCDKNGDGKLSEEEVREVLVLSASANKLNKLKTQAGEYAALIMEELDPNHLGYIEVLLKELSCINSETKGRSEICNHLAKMLKDSKGVLTGEQQTKLLYYCRNMNLVWAGTQRLSPMEPEHLDSILGYPINHTQNPTMTLVERLESLRTSYQTDTLGYHLSVLKPLFPGGITVLSLYSGIGGAEVALHRLGIYMKAVVSVESSEMKRKILRRWWQGTDQTGELVQIEDIQKLTSNKLEYLKRKFGEFDLVICESPCTYSEKGTKTIPGNSNVEELDFTLYYEFVRVLQRVRTMSGRR